MSGISLARTGTGRFFLRPAWERSERAGEFPFQNYRITIDQKTLALGPVYLENLFDHLIVHYIFCPRSSGRGRTSGSGGIKGPAEARDRPGALPGQYIHGYRGGLLPAGEKP